ncbi:MAG: hypothetical protein PHN56_00490 [Candidatus Nanoarchaeia archaeon]|nr:hypothetical protein [Candidatus Nanoarchaeia archaeon]
MGPYTHNIYGNAYLIKKAAELKDKELKEKSESKDENPQKKFHMSNYLKKKKEIKTVKKNFGSFKRDNLGYVIGVINTKNKKILKDTKLNKNLLQHKPKSIKKKVIPKKKVEIPFKITKDMNQEQINYIYHEAYACKKLNPKYTIVEIKNGLKEIL